MLTKEYPMASQVKNLRDDGAESGIDALLSPEDVSVILGIPVKTLANWRSERTGPFSFRVGCHVRYRAADVDAWISERIEDARRRR